MADQTAVFRAIADFSAIRKESRKAIGDLKALEAAAAGLNRNLSAGTAAIGNSAAAIGAAGKSTRTAAAGYTAVGVAAGKAGKGASSASHGMEALNRSMTQATQKTTVFNSGLVGMIQTMGVLRSTAAGTAVTVGALTAAGAAVGIKFNASLEQARIGFKNIFDDAEKARDVIDQIVSYARVTPFDTAGLINQVRQLTAAGFAMEEILVGSDEAATGLAVTIGNAAAAMGGGRDVADSMVQAITRIKATGRVTFEELRIFAERGVPAIDILKEKLGLTVKEVQKIGELGIEADVAIAALTEGLDERFGGAMNEQARSALGLISTFLDNIQIGMGTAFEGLFEVFKSSLMGVTDLMTEINVLAADIGFIDALAEKLPVIGPLIQSVVNFMSSLGEVVRSLAPAFEVFIAGAAAGLTMLSSVLNAAAEGFQVFADIINWLPDDLLRFAAAAVAVKVALGGVGLPLANLAAVMGRLTGAAGLAGTSNAFQSLSRVFARMGPQGMIVAAGITAVGFALMNAGKGSSQAEKEWKTASEQSEILAGASEHLKAAMDASTGEVMRNSEAWKEWLKETDAVREQLRGIEGTDLRQDELATIAANLIIDGSTPEEAMAHVRALADAEFGAGFPIPFTIEHLESNQFVAAQIAAGIERELASIEVPDLGEALLADDGGIKAQEFAAAMDRVSDSANDAAVQAAELFQLDPAGAIAALIATEEAVRSLNLAADDEARIIDALNDKFRESVGATSDGGNAASTYADTLRWVATGADDLSDEQENLISTFNNVYAATGDVDQALAAVRDEMAAVEDATGGVTDATEDYITAMDEAAAADRAGFIDLVDATKKAFEDFVDPADTFMALLGEVSDEGQLAAQQAAHDAGLSAEEWKRFPQEAGVGLKDWRIALQNSLVHQRDWVDNLATATEKFGPEVAAYFRDAGPEMAGALEAMVEDTTGESEKLAALIEEDAQLASDGFVGAFVESTTTGTGEVVAAILAGVPAVKVGAEAWAIAVSQGFESAASRVEAARARIDSAASRPIPSPTGGGTGNVPAPTREVEERHGGIRNYGALSFARGGRLPPSGRTLPQNATIKRGGPLVQWAEPGTGGEAFIPLGQSNRKRSMEIWRKTGRLIGALNFARGGVRFRGRVPGGGIAEAPEEDIDEHIEGAGGSNPFARPGGSSSSSGSSGSGASGIEDAADAAEDLADKIEEAAQNWRDFRFESKGTVGQIRQINNELANTVQFTDEWMSLMSQRQQLFDQLRSGIDSQVGTLTGLLDQAQNIRQNRRDRRQQFRDDRAALVERQNEDLARIDADLADRLVDIAERRDDQLADLAERRNDQIENANERLADAQESAAEQRADAILGLEEQLADQRASLAERTADQLAAIEENLQKQIEGRADALSRSMDPLKRYEQAWANTTQSILDNFTTQNSQFDATLAGINALRSAGLSMEAISLLGLDQGPEALSQIEALRTASAAEIAELNQLAAGRETTALQMATNISDDLFSEAASARERTLAEAADAEARLIRDYQRSLADIQQNYDRALQDANEAHAEAIADAEASYAESVADVHESYTESVADATEAAAEARAEVRAQFQESLADLREDFLADMAELEEQLNSLGEDQGLTWAQAIRRGLRSGIPGIVALAREIQRSIDRLDSLAADSPTMPGQANPNAPGPAQQAGNNGGNLAGAPTGQGGNPNPDLRYYRTRAGDRGNALAERFSTTLQRLINLNPGVRFGANGNMVLDEGIQLTVPRLHSGGMVGRGYGAQSELLALLQSGEGVMSRDALRAIKNQGGMARASDYRDISRSSRPLHVQVVTPDGRVMWEFVRPFSDEDEIIRGVMTGG